MTPSQLKANVQANNEESHYFSRASMRFFGDTMANYGVREATVRTQYNAQGEYVEKGVIVGVWELYRKRAVKHGLIDSVYFAQDDYRRVYGEWV